MARAREHGFATLALPAISTGVFGFPVARAAPVAVAALREAMEEAPGVTLVRFCFLDPAVRDAYAAAGPTPTGPPPAR